MLTIEVYKDNKINNTIFASIYLTLMVFMLILSMNIKDLFYNVLNLNIQDYRSYLSTLLTNYTILFSFIMFLVTSKKSIKIYKIENYIIWFIICFIIILISYFLSHVIQANNQLFIILIVNTIIFVHNIILSMLVLIRLSKA